MIGSVGERLRAIGFVSILLVLLVHMCRMPGNWYLVDDMQGMTFWQVVVNLGVTQALGWLAVPTFFGISGFWLVKDYDGSVCWWWRSIKKRVKTILIPMILWIAMALVYEVICGTLEVPSRSKWYLPIEVTQFWYFRTLFIYVVLSPVLLWALRYYMGGILVVGALWGMAFIGLPGQSVYFMWVNDAAFAGGMWVGLHFNELICKVAPVWRRQKRFVPIVYVLLIVVLIVLGFLHMRILTNRVRYLMIPFGCACLWMASPWFVRVLAYVKFVYSLNVFIFAIHFVVMSRVGAFLVTFGLDWRSIPFMVMQFVLEVAICVGLGLTVKRFFPKTLVALSGGRA